MPNTSTVNLVGVGGKPPYTFAVVNDAQTTIPSIIVGAQGNQLQVDATLKQPGIYTSHVRITDANLISFDSIINIRVVDPTIFTILNEDQSFQPTSFPAVFQIPLQSSGGSGTITWSLIPSITTLQGVTLDVSNNLNFTLTSYGQGTVGVTATDQFNNVVSKVLTFSIINATVFSLVDGQVEVKVNVPTTNVGTHQFTLSIQDSNNATVAKTFNYQAQTEVSDIRIPEAFFDHFWSTSDNLSIVFPVLGNFAGFSLGSTNTVVASNGLTASVDNTNKVVKVQGPPTSFQNSQIDIPLAILNGNTQIATVTRTFTLSAHNGTSDIGTFQCNTRPYIVGDGVGLNPFKPWFNSPNIFKNSAYTVRVQAGSTLPVGLSLDSNTGLIYGTVAATGVVSSTVEYIDISGIIHGTVVINWDIRSNDFSLIDNLVTGQIQSTYNSNLTSTSQVPLSSVDIYRGRLPQGLNATIDISGTSVDITGTPVESGYFDIWFHVVNTNGQNSYMYRRLAVDYIPPLVILTNTLQNIVTGQPYSFQLIGFGGVQPYTWALTLGTLPTSITFNTSSGTLSGTTAIGTYNQNLTFTLTDTRGVSTSSVLNLTINNTLNITTPVLPVIVPNQNYSFQLAAQGGTTPYSWSLNAGSPALPTGISLNATTGILSGVTSLLSFNQNIVFKVTDSGSNTATKTLNLQVGAATGLLIDTSGVGSIPRGGQYQGLLRVFGTFTAPITWQVAPNSPSPLPAGLTLAATTSNQGITAIISGRTTAVITNLSVQITAVDANGASASAFVILNSVSTLAVLTTTIPPGTVSGAYSAPLTASGFNTPFTWSLDPLSNALPSGYSITSAGVIQGTASAIFNNSITVRVTDSIGDFAKQQLQLIVQNSTLVISTASPLPNVTAGRNYSVTLAATGGQPFVTGSPYRWSISPNSASALPSGLSLDPNLGTVSGNSTQSGFNKAVTFRVTDSIGAFVDKALNISVIAGLQLKTGVDFVDGTATNYLGYEVNGDPASISPRPNDAFQVIATGVVSTQPSQLQVSIGNVGISATVVSINAGTAIISLTGAFSAGAVGDNNLVIGVTDAGVNVTATFKWKVYDAGTLRLTPSAGTIPTLVLP